MKPCILLLFLIFVFTKVQANKIDALKTDREVEVFMANLLQEKYHNNHSTIHLKKPDSIINYIPCDSTIIRESNIWKKIDFNKDGLTDLFVVIYERDTINSDLSKYAVYVVIDKSKNKF